MQSVSVDAAGRQERYGLAQRTAARAALGDFARSNAPNAFTVFGEVDELKVVREGANQRLGFVVAETLHQRVELDSRFEVTAAKGLGRRSRQLRLGESVISTRFAENLS